MIFQRTLLREFAIAGIGVFVVLLAITGTVLLVRFLGEAVSGNIASEAIIAMLGFTAINYLPVLLSLTVFIAVLLTITRSYRDSEMIVWFGAGISLAAWIRPVLIFAMPLVLTITILSFFLSPWAVSKREEYKHQLDSRDEVSNVAPGVFKESKQADRVFFVENLTGDQNMVSNIFVHSAQHQKVGTMVAKRGYQYVARNGDRFLVLLNGRRYEGPPGSPEYKITEFERYAIRIEAYEAKREQPSVKSMGLMQLLHQDSPLTRAELSWRLGLPISSFVLGLMAIPLSFVNPRAGRSTNLILALLIFMTYSNILSLAQAWIAQGKINLYTGLWAVHLGMALVLITLFYHRISWLSFSRRSRVK